MALQRYEISAKTPAYEQLFNEIAKFYPKKVLTIRCLFSASWLPASAIECKQAKTVKSPKVTLQKSHINHVIYFFCLFFRRRKWEREIK